MNPFFWLFALLSLLPLVSATRSRGIVIRLQQPDGRVLHRSKRDWMWRQFFLSEEYTGSNYQYVGKVRDSTVGASSILHPRFHPHHPQPASQTGTDFQTRPWGGEKVKEWKNSFEVYVAWHNIWICAPSKAAIKAGKNKATEMGITQSQRHEYSDTS